MSQPESENDYYATLGADQSASRKEIERLYKRLAAQHHPDRGGSEAEMKSLNEAYRVLRDEATRRAYDHQRDDRRRRPQEASFVPVATPTAQDVGMLCLLLGFFLLFLVRFQWIWFLWPLAILAFFVMVFGVLLSHAAMLSFKASLSTSNLLRRHKLVWEALFWATVGSLGYGIYLLFTAV
jgi:curved DNA-binding protein CbpA